MIRRLLATFGPPAACLIVGGIVDSATVSALLNVAALIFLAVVAMEAALAAGQSPMGSAPDRLKDSVSDEQLVELIAFIGVSTPTIARAAQRDAGLMMLADWLEVVAARLNAAMLRSCGVMVVREKFALRGDDLAPYCEVEMAAGAPQCTLPAGSNVPVSAGVSLGLAQYVGARAIYLSSLEMGEGRYWCCITFSVRFNHHLLDAVCDALTGPVASALAISQAERHAGYRAMQSSRRAIPPPNPRLGES